jgi:cysteine desulfurase
MKSIYLDFNSTTPIDPAVASAMADCHAAGYVNPASQHRLGQHARTELERLRSSIICQLGGNFKGMDADSLIFTSGGTESNNLALAGLAAANCEHSKRIVISPVEHPSVTGISEFLKNNGYTIDTVPVDCNGVCQLDSLTSMLAEPTSVVSIQLANHETGVLQPIREIAELCRAAGVLLHTDAVQAVGKIPISFQNLQVDALTFTAHKFHGPRGIGGLLLRHGVNLQPMLFGGFQQMGLRPGTEDVALVTGMNTALQLYLDKPVERNEHLSSLRNRLLNQLRSEIPDIVVNGADAAKTPQTLNVSFPGIDRQAFLMAADMEGIAISTGSACASGSSEPSPVLLAMKADEATIEGAVRISVGCTTTVSEIDDTIERFIRIFARLSGKQFAG